MASGIDLSKYEDFVIEGLIQAKLDIELIDYYKLVVATHAKLGNVDGANDTLRKLIKLIYMDDSETKTKDAQMIELLEEVAEWKVTIKPASISMPQNRLIPRNKVLPKK